MANSTDQLATVRNEMPDSMLQDVAEGIRIRLVPAPVLRRVVALAIDMGIIGFCSYIVFILAALLGAAGAIGAIGLAKFSKPVAAIIAIVLLALLLLAVFASFHAYFVYFEYKKGASLGKRVMGLRVVSTSGQALTLGQAIYRDLVRWYIDLAFFLPALISIAATEKRQRVGDLLAGTLVVYSKAKDEEQNFIYVKPSDFEALRAALMPEKVPQEFLGGYLPLAYRAFVLGESQKMGVNAELASWEPKIRGQLLKTEEFGLNSITVLRFYAELCYQQRTEEEHESRVKPKKKI